MRLAKTVEPTCHSHFAQSADLQPKMKCDAERSPTPTIGSITNREGPGYPVFGGYLGGVWSGIEKIPGVMGGDACVQQTRIPVWLLVSLRQQGATEAYLLEDYPTLTAADLVNAWLYTDAYSDEIEVVIVRQEVA